MPVSAAATVVTFNITTNVLMVADINTYWKQKVLGVPTSIVTAALSSDMTVVVPKLTGPIAPQQGGANWYLNQPVTAELVIQTNQTILVGTEEMTVVSIDGPDASTGNYLLTVSRGTSQTGADGATISFPSAVTVDHAPGEPVSILTYRSPWELATQLWFMPAAAAAQISLGMLSAMFQSSTTGSVS